MISIVERRFLYKPHMSIIIFRCVPCSLVLLSSYLLRLSFHLWSRDLSKQLPITGKMNEYVFLVVECQWHFRTWWWPRWSRWWSWRTRAWSWQRGTWWQVLFFDSWDYFFVITETASGAKLLKVLWFLCLCILFVSLISSPVEVRGYGITALRFHFMHIWFPHSILFTFT